MRVLKLLTSFVTWRWTPCVALITSSLLYVLLVVLVTPKTLSFGGGPKAVNVIDGVEPANAMTPTAPRTDRGSASPRRPAPAPQMPSPGAAAPVAPPPASPPDEARRADPPPTPTPTPAPAPAADQAEEEEEPAAPPPPAPNPNTRFMATPLRFIPQLAASAGAPSPPPGADAH